MNKLNTLTSLQAYFPACTAEQVRTTARLRCTNIYHVYRGVSHRIHMIKIGMGRITGILGC